MAVFQDYLLPKNFDLFSVVHSSQCLRQLPKGFGSIANTENLMVTPFITR